MGDAARSIWILRGHEAPFWLPSSVAGAMVPQRLIGNPLEVLASKFTQKVDFVKPFVKPFLVPARASFIICLLGATPVTA